mmetsp:Transcript_16107/g.51398  ORF Transcript_16107/g.51398 Transcript_16107/m.51398 type:complete len:351 (+) Transcript_16107:414-1466(+)
MRNRFGAFYTRRRDGPVRLSRGSVVVAMLVAGPGLALLRQPLLDVVLLAHLLVGRVLGRLFARRNLVVRGAAGVGRPLALALALVVHGVQLLHEDSGGPLLRLGHHRPNRLVRALLESLLAELGVLLGLALERQRRLQRLWHRQLVEPAGHALHRLVQRVLGHRRRHAQLRPHLGRAAHARVALAVRHQQVADGVVQGGLRHGHPRLEQDQVRTEQLVLKRGAEAAVVGLERALHLPADTRDGAYGCAFKLGDLERGGEHVLDEGSVLEDLEGCSDQLELLDHFQVGRELKHHARGRDAEGAAGVGLEGEHARAGRRGRTVEDGHAVHVLGRVLDVPEPQVRVLHVVQRQ